MSWEWFWELSGANVFYRHALCLTNDPVIMGLYVVCDLATWLSYMIIGGSFWWQQIYTIRLSSNAMVLYGLFIFLCGISHLTKTLTLFAGIYRIDILVVAAMAGVSVAVAIMTLMEAFSQSHAGD